MRRERMGVPVLFLAALGLTACGALTEVKILSERFWASSPFIGGDEAELGFAEMAKGNYILAENHFQKALKAKDVHALLGAGVLYQNTGQLTKARQMYEAVLANRPPENLQFIVLSNLMIRPISHIASVNLSLLDTGGVIVGMKSGLPRQAGAVASQALPPLGAAPQVSGAPTGSAIVGGMSTSPPGLASAGGPVETVSTLLTGGDANIISRFTTLRALSDQGLLTPQEFDTRRQANIGALLPLTAPPSSAGLDRPVPATEQVTNRLRAIGRALEMRAITVSQHSSERSMILDALMPAAPVVVANPAPPPQGLLEAADSVRRLEQLRDGGYISSDEYVRERAAIEAAMAPAPIAEGPMQALSPAEQAAAVPEGPQPAVHLASYRSRKQADRGWAQLKRAHRTLLGQLQNEVSKVNLGSKGTFYRLKVGPFADQSEAADICRQLKRRRQFCEPTFMGMG